MGIMVTYSVVHTTAVTENIKSCHCCCSVNEPLKLGSMQTWTSTDTYVERIKDAAYKNSDFDFTFRFHEVISQCITNDNVDSLVSQQSFALKITIQK